MQLKKEVTLYECSLSRFTLRRELQLAKNAQEKGVMIIMIRVLMLLHHCV